MKRRLLLLALPALFAGRGARAQAPYAALKPGQVLRGQFAQERTLAGFAHPLQSSGTFVLAPGHGLIWRTLQPFAIVTVITADGLVQDVNGAETTHLAAAQLPFLAKFYKLLSSALGGEWQALDGEFQTTRDGDAQHWELKLVPRGGADPQTMPLRAITLRGGRFVEDVRISHSNNDSDRLVFSEQVLGVKLSDTETALLHQAAQ